MWVFTEIGFFSVVSYDANRDPENENKFSKKYVDPKDKKAWWSFDFPSFKKPDKDPKVMVRARVRIDLENLLEYLPGEAKITEWKARDYPYRVVIPQEWWSVAISELSEDINYTNFKNRVTDAQGHERHMLYMTVWSAMNNAEEKLKPKKYDNRGYGGHSGYVGSSGNADAEWWNARTGQYEGGKSKPLPKGKGNGNGKGRRDPDDTLGRELDVVWTRPDQLTVEDLDWLDSLPLTELSRLGISDADMDELHRREDARLEADRDREADLSDPHHVVSDPAQSLLDAASRHGVQTTLPLPGRCEKCGGERNYMVGGKATALCYACLHPYPSATK
jgi:hypothetical protein